MSMANSLEVRCPFTDHQIIEFGLSIPFGWKYRLGNTKRIVREAMQGVLPESVLRKKKMGFNPPLPQWINSELKPLIAEMLSRKAIERRGIFRPEAVEQLLKDHAERKRDNALKIWGLLILEVWYRMYIDRQGDLFEESLQAAMTSENRA
jgi:asparagine synthase (glutamine-hydrolysing)